MGNIPLPSLDAILQIKDPNKRFEELVNTMGILIKNLSEINGYLNSKNIRANSITADRMNVNELSAITANLGTITAGIIRGIEIYGSFIATAEGTYPRAEMSNTLNMFRALTTALRYVEIVAYDSDSGSPTVNWEDNGSATSAFMESGKYEINTTGGTQIGTANGDIDLISADNINLQAVFGLVILSSWSKLYSSGSGESLQTVINNIYSAIATKANAFSGFSGSFDTGDGRVATFSNGICTSVV